jgi:hypothetical protein
MMHETGYEFFHITVVELLRLLLLYVLLPLAIGFCLWMLCLKRLLEAKFKSIRKRIETFSLKRQFEEIFRKGTEKNLEMQYINNALSSANQGNDPETRMLALQQLSQSSHEIARDGLIKILSKETDSALINIIITCLSKIVKNIESE